MTRRDLSPDEVALVCVLPRDVNVREVLDEIVIVQDAIALARIDANAPSVPYPLINRDRRSTSTLRLAWYLLRLIVWRLRTARRPG